MSKAFVCILVDGPSDIDSLQRPFEDLFDQIGGDDIDIAFRHAIYQKKPLGDITSKDGITPDNIQKFIHKFYFKDIDKSSDLGWNDVTTIIHLIDLDGAYIHKDSIKLFTEEEEAMADSLVTHKEPKNTLYLDDHIAVRKNLLLRQETLKRKRQNIEKLLELDTITFGKKSVRYALYYFSSNIDHFLHGNANMTGSEKMTYAADFSQKVQDASSLVKYFSEHPGCSAADYAQSWKDLRYGTASLQRRSNIHLLIERIQNSTLEDWS